MFSASNLIDYKQHGYKTIVMGASFRNVSSACSILPLRRSLLNLKTDMLPATRLNRPTRLSNSRAATS